MTKEIVFFDIDGTLVNHDKKIPTETKEAIQELKNSGVYVAIATGRAPFMFENIREELGINSFVAFNGQYVVFEGKTVYENPISAKQIQSLIKSTDERSHPLVFQTSREMRATTDQNKHIKSSLESLKFNYPEIDPTFYHNNAIYQVLLFCEAEQQSQYEKYYDQLRFVRWHKYSCDVMPNGGSKAIGVDKLMEASGINPLHAYAFGDGLNDMEMIKHVQTGIAMGNAVPELKEIADIVTDDVDNLGIVNGLTKVGLIK